MTQSVYSDWIWFFASFAVGGNLSSCDPSDAPVVALNTARDMSVSQYSHPGCARFQKSDLPDRRRPQILSIVRSKNISVFRKFDQCYGPCIPPRLKRGDRERHERGARDAMDADALTDERRRRGRRSRVVPTPRRWRQVSRLLQRPARGDGGNQALAHRGELV
jgi:hypothetical protein